MIKSRKRIKEFFYKYLSSYGDGKVIYVLGSTDFFLEVTRYLEENYQFRNLIWSRNSPGLTEIPMEIYPQPALKGKPQNLVKVKLDPKTRTVISVPILQGPINDSTLKRLFEEESLEGKFYWEASNNGGESRFDYWINYFDEGNYVNKNYLVLIETKKDKNPHVEAHKNYFRKYRGKFVQLEISNVKI